MSLKTIIFADDHLVKMFRAHRAPGARTSDLMVVHISDSYEDCLQNVLQFNADVVILQIKPPVVRLHDFFHELNALGLSSILVLFKVKKNNQIVFSMTKHDITDYDGLVGGFFMRSLSAEYSFRYHFIYDQGDIHGSDEFKLHKLERTNFLNEILHGITQEEFQFYRNKAQLNLRDEGYYLYVWELMVREYPDNNLNKYNYFFANEELEKECQEVLNEYRGGEAFFANPHLLCLIINDYDITSSSARQCKIREITNRLNSVTESKMAFRYMSDRIKKIEDVRDAYESHYYHKTFKFFCSDVSLMTKKYIEDTRKKVDFDTVNALLKDIKELIYHDIFNPKLQEWIKTLFLDLIKPSLDYNLYQYCYMGLKSAMIEKYSRLNIDSLPMQWSQSPLSYTSIEEIYREMLESSDLLKEMLEKKFSRRKAIVMQAVEYIEQNFAEDITVDAVASNLFHSSSHLSQLFKKELGSSITKYIINYRIQRAEELLSASSDPIYDIALRVGFSDSKHFSKTFKKVTGMTPSQFRKNG